MKAVRTFFHNMLCNINCDFYFIYFLSGLTVLAYTPLLFSMEGEKVGIPTYILDIRRKIFSLGNEMLAVGFSQMPFIRGRKFSFISSFLRVFNTVVFEFCIMADFLFIEMII